LVPSSRPRRGAPGYADAALIIPTYDPARATSGAHYLREMLPQVYWPVVPSEQTPERVRARVLEFGRTHRSAPQKFFTDVC